MCPRSSIIRHLILFLCLPAVDEPPLPLAQIQFDVSPRGCAITLPMNRQEHIPVRRDIA